MRKIAIIYLMCMILSCLTVSGQGQWTNVPTIIEPDNRHECSLVASGDKYYLLGGRGIKAVEIFDPSAITWTPVNPSPFEVHHFQAVDYYGLIYIVCAQTGGFPNENALDNIYIYDPVDDNWHQGDTIPNARKRGSAGLVKHDDKLYAIAGITNGHLSGWVPWLDEFDPQTNVWTTLPDAPESRDHFHAVVVNNKLVVAGGRKTGFGGSTYNATIGQVDIYDFIAGSWSTLPANLNIPTERAGCSAVNIGSEVIIIGGESGTQTVAHDETEGFNVNTNSWRTLDFLATGRHGTQAVVDNNVITICCGSGNQGGSPELDNMEKFAFGTPGSPAGAATIQGTPTGPASFDFKFAHGDTNVVYIKNTGGNQALLVNDIRMKNGTSFSIVNIYRTPFAVRPGDSIRVDIIFDPVINNYISDSLIVEFLVPQNAVFKMFIEGNQNPHIDVSSDTILCTGDSTMLFVDGPFTNFLWSNGKTTASIFVTVEDDYYAIVSIGAQMFQTDTVSILVSQPIAMLSQSSVTCNQGSDGIISLSTSAGYPPYSFLWSNGSTSEDQDSLLSGTYTITITDSRNCSVSQSITVNEPAISTDALAFFTWQASALTVTFSDQSINANTYQWDFGDNSPAVSDTNPVHTFAITGSYDVKLEVTNDCSIHDTTINILLITTGVPAINQISEFYFNTEIRSLIVKPGSELRGVNGRLLLMDSMGRQLNLKNIPVPPNGNQILIPIENLSKGMYFALFFVKNQVFQCRFLVVDS